MDLIQEQFLVKKYGEIYSLSYSAGKLYFRAPTRGEISSYLRMAEEELSVRADFIFDTCYIEENEVEDILMGDVISFHDKVVYFFGIGEDQCLIEYISHYREMMNSAEYMLQTLILRAFPGMTERSILDMTMDEFARYAAMAEAITGSKVEIVTEKPKTKKNLGNEILSSMPSVLPEAGVDLKSMNKQFVNFEEKNKKLESI